MVLVNISNLFQYVKVELKRIHFEKRIFLRFFLQLRKIYKKENFEIKIGDITKKNRKKMYNLYRKIVKNIFKMGI